MILILDLTNSGTAHVPLNRGLAHAAALAFPQSRVRMHAEPEHLAALRDDPAMRGLPNLDFAPIMLSPHYRWRTHIVSPRRFAQEWRTLRTCLRAAPRGEPHLLVLASATPTAILAALLLARASRDQVFVQVGMHGNLNDVAGWRPRNPVLRALDLRAMLSRRDPRMRILVFEKPIREALEAIIPGAAARTDVLPHPVDGREALGHPAPPADGPLRVGLIGMATESKGLTPYLETARLFRQRHGDRIEFHIVGGRPGDVPPERFGDIAHGMSSGHIPRAVFAERMAGLHHVFLPLDPRYYDLSPSGGLMDAVAWCKPVIASRVRITESLFQEAGDIGDLCDGIEAMRSALEAALAERDSARYARQVTALERLRESRGPEAQALEYRDIVRRGFPDFAAPEPLRGTSAEGTAQAMGES